jgi:hypothetical protein
MTLGWGSITAAEITERKREEDSRRWGTDEKGDEIVSDLFSHFIICLLQDTPLIFWDRHILHLQL